MPRTEEYIKMLRFTLTQPHTTSRGGAKTSFEELAMYFGLDIFLHPMGARSSFVEGTAILVHCSLLHCL